MRTRMSVLMGAFGLVAAASAQDMGVLGMALGGNGLGISSESPWKANIGPAFMPRVAANGISQIALSYGVGYNMLKRGRYTLTFEGRGTQVRNPLDSNQILSGSRQATLQFGYLATPQLSLSYGTGYGLVDRGFLTSVGGSRHAMVHNVQAQFLAGSFSFGAFYQSSGVAGLQMIGVQFGASGRF